MTQFMHSQKGFAYVRYTITLMVVAFFVLLAYRLVPVYFENITILNVIQSMESIPGMDEKSERKWKAELQNQFDINNIKRVSVRDLDIEKEDSGVQVGVLYEVRQPLLFNIDVVVSFDRKIKVPFSDARDTES